MADTLLIHYSFNQPDHAVWSQVNNQGELSAKISRGSVQNATEMAANSSKVVVLLDSTCVHFNKLLLPTQNRQKMLRAVPYALEEQIAEDVDDFHFVIDKPGVDGKIAVAGIHRHTLNTLLQTFDDAGLFVDAIIPDALCLTADNQQWSVLYFEDKVYVQFDTLYGGLFDRDMLKIVLQGAVKQYADNLPQRIIVFSTENDSTDDLPELTENSIELVPVNYNTHPLVVFCGQYKHALALNLLQDKYKPKRKNAVQWGKWGLAASLAALWLVLHLGSTSIQYYDLTEKNRTIKAQMVDIYKKAFPESKRTDDPRKFMESRLKELKGNNGNGGSSIIELLANSAEALSRDKNITIDSINYRNNRMDISLNSKNLQAIESLNKSLNNTGLKSEITSSTSEKDSVKGNIRLQKAES